MARKPQQFAIGDRVAYSATFLRSTCQHEIGHWRGTVRAIEPLGQVQFVCIAWDHGSLGPSPHYADIPYGTAPNDGLGRVIAPNLTLVSRIAADSALAPGS